jgi:endo-1,4-beta-xylanase
MGIDYIRVAFDEAKNVAPDATLMYNDFDLEKDNIKRAQVHTFLAPLIKSGLVNAVGVQMHFNGTHPPDRTKVLAALKDIGSWGVPVHITEFDVDMTDFPRTQAEKLLAQAKIYYEMMSAFLESGVGASFSTFGFTDLTSLYGTDKSDEALASMPLPFDSDLDPKAAYFAMLKATSEYLLAL